MEYRELMKFWIIKPTHSCFKVRYNTFISYHSLSLQIKIYDLVNDYYIAL